MRFKTTVTFALFGAALAVRALPSPSADAGPREVGSVEAPIQLLRRGGELRHAELDALVSEELGGVYRAARTTLARLDGCPPLLEWLATDAGQRTERAIVDLAHGGEEASLGSIALVFLIGRRTRWEPGVFGGTEAAGRLAELLATWLDTCAADAARDPLLEEPALAAALLFGAVQHRAHEGGALTRSRDTVREAARARLRGVLEGGGGAPSPLGRAFARRYAGAWGTGLEGGLFLARFAESARQWFPDMDGGSCD